MLVAVIVLAVLVIGLLVGCIKEFLRYDERLDAIIVYIDDKMRRVEKVRKEMGMSYLVSGVNVKIGNERTVKEKIADLEKFVGMYNDNTFSNIRLPAPMYGKNIIDSIENVRQLATGSYEKQDKTLSLLLDYLGADIEETQAVINIVKRKPKKVV